MSGLSLRMITIDCQEPRTLATFWAGATGEAVVQDLGEGAFVIVGGQPALGFQRVDQPTPGKNRVHLDTAGGARDDEVARLVTLGATEIESHSMGGTSWTVMTDPEGNVFCVGEPAQS